MRRDFINQFSEDRKGSTGIVFGLMAIPVMLTVGMAIDLGRVMSLESRVQGALDAAVLAAANLPADQQVDQATKFLNANLTGAHVPFGTLTTSFAVDGTGNFEGTANVTVPLTFMQLLGVNEITASVGATAKPNQTTNTTTTQTVTTTVTVAGSVPCIHVMDQNATRALKLISNSSFDSRYCEVHVRSNDIDAIYTDSESNVRWKKMLVKGAGGTQLSTKDIIMDAPNKVTFNAAIVADPYTAAVSDVVRAITAGTCSSANTNKSFSSGATVNPGTYCGTTTFNGVKFSPGLYIIASTSGSDGKLNLLGKLDGSAGVSFFLADSKAKLGSYSASEGTVLNAATSGTSRGLLFFEASNRGSNWSFTASSLSKNYWNGVIYLPSANLTLKSWSGESDKVMKFALICNQLYMDSWSGITNLYAWTPFNATSPLTLPGTTTTVTTTQDVTTTNTTNGWLQQ